MSVGPASSRGNVSEQDAAARRAAEEARRAAEAARRAAEAARKAAEAQQAAEAALKSGTAFEGTPSRQAEFDKRLGTEAPATSLLTEDAKDGQVNCLDVAADWANKATPELRGRSEMVFLKDTRAGAEGESGHVVVRQGESVFDPTTKKSYESLEAFKKAQPHYEEAGSLSANHVKNILAAPPGSPERAAALERAKVPPGLQKMMVADSEKPATPPKDLKEAKARTDNHRQHATKALEKAPRDEKAAKQAQDVVTDARKKLSGASQELTDAEAARKAVAERPAPRPGDAERLKALDKRVKNAEAKVDKAQGAVEQAESDAKKTRNTANDSRKSALETATGTLQAAKDANLKAKEAGEPPPYPAADKVQDILDVQGTLSPEEQTALLGGPMIPTPEGTARADMKALQWNGTQAETNDRDFQPKFDGLKQKLEANPDPAYQKELIRLARPWIENNIAVEIGRIDRTPSRVREFGDLAKGLSDEGQQALAQAVGAGVKDLEPQQVDLATTSKYDLALIRELGSKGAPMAKELAGQVKEVRERFTDAKKKVEALNEQLGTLASGFSGAMTPEQRTRAINAFKERHKEEYDSLEKAAQGLSNAVAVSGDILKQGASLPDTSPNLKHEAAQVVKELGAFANTDAGQKLIDAEVEKQSVGAPSTLDGINSFLGGGDAAKILGKDVLSDMSKGLTNAITKSLGAKALRDNLDGKDPDNSRAIKLFRDGLANNARLMGINPDHPEDLPNLQKAFTDLLEHKEGAVENFRTTLNEVELQASGAGGDSGTAPALRGLAAMAGVLGIAKDSTDIAKQFTDKDGNIDKSKMAGDLIKLFGDVSSTTADSALLFADMVNRFRPDGATQLLGDVSKAGRFLRVAGPVGGLLGALGDSIGAYHAAKDGNTLEFASKSMTAVGGALLSAAVLSNVVPGAGQIVGGALFLAGTGLNIYAKYKEGKLKEADTKAFLEGAGMPPALVEKIKDPELAAKTGQFLSQLAKRTDMSPELLQVKLGGMDKRQFDTLIKAVENTKMDKTGFVESDADGGTYKDFDVNSRPRDYNDPRAIKDDLGSMDDVITYLHRNEILVSEKHLVS